MADSGRIAWDVKGSRRFRRRPPLTRVDAGGRHLRPDWWTRSPISPPEAAARVLRLRTPGSAKGSSGGGVTTLVAALGAPTARPAARPRCWEGARVSRRRGERLPGTPAPPPPAVKTLTGTVEIGHHADPRRCWRWEVAIMTHRFSAPPTTSWRGWRARRGWPGCCRVKWRQLLSPGDGRVLAWRCGRHRHPGNASSLPHPSATATLALAEAIRVGPAGELVDLTTSRLPGPAG